MVAHLINYQLIDSKFEPYDSEYPQNFSTIKDLIYQLLSKIEIEHIGITAITGMSGKQIIDILIPCNKSEFTNILSKLEEIGFQDTPFLNIPQERPMKVAGIIFKEKFYNIHAHLTPKNSDVHLDNIYFREQLRKNTQLVREYKLIKQKAVSSGKVEATEYNKAKSPFIQSVLKGRQTNKSE